MLQKTRLSVREEFIRAVRLQCPITLSSAIQKGAEVNVNVNHSPQTFVHALESLLLPSSHAFRPLNNPGESISLREDHQRRAPLLNDLARMINILSQEPFTLLWDDLGMDKMDSLITRAARHPVATDMLSKIIVARIARDIEKSRRPYYPDIDMIFARTNSLSKRAHDLDRLKAVHTRVRARLKHPQDYADLFVLKNVSKVNEWMKPFTMTNPEGLPKPSREFNCAVERYTEIFERCDQARLRNPQDNQIIETLEVQCSEEKRKMIIALNRIVGRPMPTRK